MEAHNEIDNTDAWLATLPPTRQQTFSAIAAGAIVLVGFGVLAPFADIPLPRIDVFIPIFEAIVFVTDLITSVLLFSQFSISNSRALLALASGYLFTALIIIPHVLTYPGVFSPTGLLDAGLQTTVWLYWVWHAVFPTALVIYALLKDEQQMNRADLSPRSAVGLSVVIVISLVCGLTWLTTAGDKFLPRLFLDTTHVAPLNHYVGAVASLACVIAFVVLWARRRSVLDQWLMIVALAATSELALASLSSARFTLGFYAGRIFSLITSTTVLAVLLSETTRLYARLARSNKLLQRERSNKLMNLEAMVASISHEVRQPLSAIATSGGAALRFLGWTSPDLEEVRSNVNLMIGESHRASQVFDNILALFGKADKGHEPVDVNEITSEVLRTLGGQVKDHSITICTDLMSEQLLVMGHRGQLQEVLLNLIRNAIEAMDTLNDGSRVLQVRTGRHDSNQIVVAVEDSGPGIDPKKLDGIFDAFVSTKAQGMGLGLAICRMIIQRHGGQLSAWSGKKKGAVFQFILPTIKA